MTTKERLVLLIEDRGMSKASFLKKVGLQRGLLDTDKMQGAVSDSHLAKIINTFPEVNLEWLVTGDGQMYKPTVILPPDSVSIDRYEQKVEECVRLRVELETLKTDMAVNMTETKRRKK